MEVRENLELVEVSYENSGKKAILTFLDQERGEVRETNWNKQVYDRESGKWFDDAEKAEKVEKWANDIFNCSFDSLPQVIGTPAAIHTMYIYERFNSLFEVQQVSRFTKEMVGEIYETTIDEIIWDDLGIKVRFTIDGSQYESKFIMAKYVESMKKYFPDPNLREKKLAQFRQKFGVGVEEKDTLIGERLLIEVKMAFGKIPYGEIKNMPARKKK